VLILSTTCSKGVTRHKDQEKRKKKREKKSKHFEKENAHHMLFEMPAFCCT
jgi:hypothetical protein